ncbi:MAG: 1-phosphofructokinase family hexose kinase [Pyrinomonadaceae bacterium]
MIICISANPAIDRRVRVKKLVRGEVIRAVSAETFAGGKAAHVAMAVSALGEEVVWLGFVGGAAGDQLEKQLRELNIHVVSVRTKASTRTNDEIIDEDGRVTEILEPGGPVTSDEVRQLNAAIRMQLSETSGGCQVVLSGSLPTGMPKEFYSEIVLMTQKVGGNVILDTSGEALMISLRSCPELIKPNREEAEKAVGFQIRDDAAAISAAAEMRLLGAREVAISLGAEGIVWSNGETALVAKPPKVEVISTVGCGDATVAGFVVGARRNLDQEERIRLAAACGAANCTARLPGQITDDEVERLLPLVAVERISIER